MNHAGSIVCAYRMIAASPAEAACGIALQLDPMATATSAPAKRWVLSTTPSDQLWPLQYSRRQEGMGGRKVGRCEPPNLICQHLAMQPARQHVGGVSRLRKVATLWAETPTAATSQRITKRLTWLMPIATGRSSNVATEGNEREKVAPIWSCLLRQL